MWFISTDEIDGVDEQLRITDRPALEGSLAAAGLDPAQISAIAADDITIERFTALCELEVAELRRHGYWTDGPELARAEFGRQRPSYVWAAPPEWAHSRASRFQIEVQNRFTGAFASFYDARTLPPPDEQLRRTIEAANEFIDCARRKGLEPPQLEVASADDLDDFYRWYGRPEWDIDCAFLP
ncbi:MAG: hypothetical protein S0880_02905 [Actinomycetota bacterium]|nr:hypothetical protein [Actinomycetota bacterium]